MKFPIPTSRGYESIPINSIEYIEADDKMATVYLNDKKQIISTKGIGYFEDELKEYKYFMRVHGSYLVNLEMVKNYRRKDSGILVLLSEKEISVSRSHQQKVLNFFRPKNDKKIIGWLIVDESKALTQKFLLKEGKQIVGRKSVVKPCDIMIETENRYMSRNHFTIEVKEKLKDLYEILAYITDEKVNKPFFNQKEMEVDKAYPMDHNSLLEIEETKITFIPEVTIPLLKSNN